MMRKIKRVITEYKFGCALGCLAMVTGRTEQEINEDFENDFDEVGITFSQILDYLGEQGYSLIHKQLMRVKNKDFGRDEICKPFAPVHILSVRQYSNSDTDHVFVMLADGTTLDPASGANWELKDWYAIDQIVGIWE